MIRKGSTVLTPLCKKGSAIKQALEISPYFAQQLIQTGSWTPEDIYMSLSALAKGVGLETQYEETWLPELLNHPNFDINMPLKDGITCLHLACGNGSLKLFNALLSSNIEINLNVKDDSGKTPLEILIDHTIPYLQNNNCVNALKEAEELKNLLYALLEKEKRMPK